MSITMTDNWRKQIIENYENEGQSYYQLMKRMKQNREEAGIEETKEMFNKVLEVLEERREKGIIPSRYKQDIYYW